MNLYKNYKTKNNTWLHSVAWAWAILLTISMCFLVPANVSAQRHITYGEIITALKTKFPNKTGVTKEEMMKSLITRIKLEKVDKPLTKGSEDILKQAGATSELIELIRKHSPPLYTGKLNLPEALKGLSYAGSSIEENNKHLIDMITEYGIDFEFSDKIEAVLRDGQANDELIDLIKQKSPRTHDGPLSFIEILEDLRFEEKTIDENNEHLIEQIKLHGIDFKLKDGFEDLLKEQKASEELIEVIRKASGETNDPAIDGTTSEPVNSNGNGEDVFDFGKQKPKKYSRPNYPEEAMESNIKGSVYVNVLVSKSGGVKEAEVDSGPPMLRDLAESAAYTAIFDPFKKDGKIVEAKALIEIKFKKPKTSGGSGGPIIDIGDINIGSGTGDGDGEVNEDGFGGDDEVIDEEIIDEEIYLPSEEEDDLSNTEKESDPFSEKGTGGKTSPPAKKRLPEIVYLKASAYKIPIGRAVKISWGTKYAPKLLLATNRGERYSVSGKGSRIFRPTGTTTYILVAGRTRSRKIISRKITVVVIPNSTKRLPKINGFRASATRVSSGQSVQIFWSVSNATNVKLYENGRLFSERATKGVKVFRPTRTTIYRLMADNRGSSRRPVSRSIKVVVRGNPTQRPPRITQFGASAYTIRPGQSVRVSWNVTNATNVKLYQNRRSSSVRFRGSRIVRPTGTTTYRLVAVGMGSRRPVIRTITIKVARKVIVRPGRSIPKRKIPRRNIRNFK